LSTCSEPKYLSTADIRIIGASVESAAIRSPDRVDKDDGRNLSPFGGLVQI
jgi:hypothetical protein